jgi:hypothetical protein
MTRPVGYSQPVAPNQRELELNKPVSVFWEKASATIGQTVKIRGVVKKPIANMRPTVWVLFNKKRFQAVADVTMQGGQIIAQWVVTPFNRGLFTEGIYDVEVVYAGQPATTSSPLRIVAPGAEHNGISTFVR